MATSLRVTGGGEGQVRDFCCVIVGERLHDTCRIERFRSYRALRGCEPSFAVRPQTPSAQTSCELPAADHAWHVREPRIVVPTAFQGFAIQSI